MTSEKLSEWNAGENSSDQSNLVDWTSFDMNDVAHFDFGDMPQIEPQLREGPTEVTQATSASCSHCQCAQTKSFETMMSEIRKVVAQARDDQIEAVERRTTSLEARAALSESITRDFKESVEDRLERHYNRIDRLCDWVEEAQDKMQYLMEKNEGTS